MLLCQFLVELKFYPFVTEQFPFIVKEYGAVILDYVCPIQPESSSSFFDPGK